MKRGSLDLTVFAVAVLRTEGEQIQDSVSCIVQMLKNHKAVLLKLRNVCSLQTVSKVKGRGGKVGNRKRTRLIWKKAH